MTNETSTDNELAELVDETREAASAIIRGDMARYVELTHHAHGFTLMAPNGGPATRHENRAEEVNQHADFFQGGESTLEHVETHAWGDTAVVVMIERQHGQVGGMPDQDCSLRVTHVYRREDSKWLLVHRHADPLVHPIDLESLAAIARPRQAPQ